jgi:catechol 2,3-dioxygenase-like lactoylglutathione lyase family enzyme
VSDDHGSVSHLLLQATDLTELVTFYTDVVGFSVSERTEFGDGRPLVILEERMGLTPLPDGRADSGQAVEHIAFEVPDVDAVVASLDEHDVPVDDGPKPTSYGTSVYFFDPDGNRIECHD